MDAETKEFLTEQLQSDLDDVSRALRWSEIHASELGLVELKSRLTKMREDLKPILEQAGNLGK